MSGVTFYINSTKWSCRTYIFTFATANASLGINSWHLHFATIGGGVVHHQYRLGLAVACASTTLVALGYRDTIFSNPYGTTNADSCLLFRLYGLDGGRRAHLRAAVALWSAETALE